jgi:hypothetical protein
MIELPAITGAVGPVPVPVEPRPTASTATGTIRVPETRASE